MSSGAAEPGASRRSAALLLLAGAFASFWPAFAAVDPTNFGGYDEWATLDLAARGVLSVPHANRPLGMLWGVPANWWAEFSPTACFLAHVLYTTLGGALMFGLAARLLPGSLLFAFQAATLFMLWAPYDVARLNSVQGSLYSGITFGALSALLLLCESQLRRSRGLLAAAAATGFVVARSYEGVLPLLLVGGPLLLLRLDGPRRPWLAAWTIGMSATALVVVAPLLASSPASSYQRSVLGLDLDPLRVLVAASRQYGFHLTPLVTTAPAQLVGGPAAAAGAVYLLTFAAGARLSGATAVPTAPRRALATLALLGFVLAGLGYGVVLLTNVQPTPFRMQFLSGPGIALLLAAVTQLAASLAPPVARLMLAGALGAWMVAVGGARIVTLQSIWDRISLYPAQRSALAQLVGLAPGLRSGTLVVLLGGAKVFPETFTFRHALAGLYDRGVRGSVVGGGNVLYETRFVPDGIVFEPWEVVREPLAEPVSRHRYDQVLVVELQPSGRLTLATEWPAGLPALTEGARYDPLARVLADAPARPARALLAPRKR